MNFTERETKIIDRLMVVLMSIGLIITVLTVTFKSYFGMAVVGMFVGVYIFWLGLTIIQYKSIVSRKQ